jgi:predicted O-methyltransferase YrrM
MKWRKRMSRNLYPLLEKYRTIPAIFIEVGVQAGNTSRWLLENILLHQLSKLYGIDAYDFTLLHRKERALFELSLEGVKKLQGDFPEKFKLLKGLSYDMLARHSMYCGHFAENSVDFIYLDANNGSAFKCLYDFYLSWPLLKTGGVIIINNNTRHFPEIQNAVGFLREEIKRNGGEIIIDNCQFCIRKIA